MRKALIVGSDHYTHIKPLSGCVNDAHAVKAILERHADGTVNFVTPRILTGSGPADIVERSELKDAVRELFAGDADIALLYFAGHGYIEDTGGFLCAGDCRTGDEGFSLTELMTLASKSNARNKVIILDSCHSGIAGDRPMAQGIAEIKEGMTILTASTAEQYAVEVPGGGAGVFTNLFVDALGGAAANLVGDVTPGSVYAHIDQSLGPWAQRPVFKTNVKTFVSLRKATPPIPLADLQAVAIHFPHAGYNFKLDPAYEPERSQEQRNDPNIPPPDPENFQIMQKRNAMGD
jgi:Caspase domain